MGISEGYVSEPRSHSPARGLPNPKLNVLVDNNGRACLTCSSTLTIASDQPTATSATMLNGAAQFMSPERIAPGLFGLGHGCPTKESDCYALGMVIYEVLSGRMPFSQGRDAETMLRVLDGTRPGRPQGDVGKLFTDGMWEILECCWKHQPVDRISAKDVLLRLERIPSPLRLPDDVDEDMETVTGDQSDDASSYSGAFLGSIPGSSLITPLRCITGPLSAQSDRGLPVPLECSPSNRSPTIPQYGCRVPDPPQVGNPDEEQIGVYLCTTSGKPSKLPLGSSLGFEKPDGS